MFDLAVSFLISQGFTQRPLSECEKSNQEVSAEIKVKPYVEGDVFKPGFVAGAHYYLQPSGFEDWQMADAGLVKNAKGEWVTPDGQMRSYPDRIKLKRTRSQLEKICQGS